MPERGAMQLLLFLAVYSKNDFRLPTSHSSLKKYFFNGFRNIFAGSVILANLI